jgi:NAD(P) transhydrogenase subunit alpha
MKVGIPQEVRAGERRVAATPDTVTKLINMGCEVLFEAGAGVGASFPDDAYSQAGATLVDDAEKIWKEADIIFKVNPPEENPASEEHELDLLKENGTLISLLFPSQNKALIERMAAKNCTVFALDCVPRITRAQKMDVLSSMANIAGYRAIIEASNHYSGFFSGQITAAGRSEPARVLIIGAGVAGLSAIATARSLGAEVRAFDTRLATKEQVQSLGASFLELQFEESGEGQGGYAKTMSKEFIDAEMALFLEQCKEVNIIVTTALIPGKKAPLLITKEMVAALKPGSVVVDLAAEQGGNCALTEANKVVQADGVTIIGYTDLTSRLATHASQFFGTNLFHFFDELVQEGQVTIEEDNEAIRGALVLRNGEMMWPPPKIEKKVSQKPVEQELKKPDASIKKEQTKAAPAKQAPDGSTGRRITALVAVLIFTAIGLSPDTEFIQHFTVFVLACFVGWQVVWNVSPALHTPLMSVTNAISGIIIVGGILQAASNALNWIVILGLAAIFFASINVFGGFLVTQRMLKMFRK